MRRMISSKAGVALVAGILFATVFLYGRSAIVLAAYAQDNHDRDQASCTDASLNGTYGTYAQGTSGVGTITQAPLARVGIITVANGSILSGHQTTSKNGLFTDAILGGGTYRVDPDCTGEMFLKTGTLASKFTIVDGGKEVFVLSMTPNNAVIETWKKVGQPER